jgi:hypothetical protein
VNHYQLICETKPYCACVGPNVWDQCACRTATAGVKRCVECEAELVEINVETGAPVPAAVAS